MLIPTARHPSSPDLFSPNEYIGRLIGVLRRLTSKMAAIGKADWQIPDWRGELIDRRLDYYHEGHEEHEGLHS